MTTTATDTPQSTSQKVHVKKITSRTGGRGATLAQKADRHALYQHSVQNVESEIDFVDATFKKLRKRKAKLLREDFCGTGNTSCEWVRRRSSNRAIGVDIDPDPLQWGLENNVGELSDEERERVELIESDVFEVETEKVDCLLAMNFSYWLFMTRDRLRAYFELVRDALVDDGLLFIDCYGGYDAFREYQERRKVDDEEFTYIWDQHDYDPVSGQMQCYIHFVFPDGSRLDRAFDYRWRLWTLPELRELLTEAGFKKVTVYWEGTDEETGEGDGEFAPAERGEADAGWISYVVAER